MDRVRIFDTTLRDGEQSPGATMTSAEKLEVARALTRLGVDVIEAGFPAASPDDLAAVRRIARGRQPRVSIAGRAGLGEPPTICGLARATKSDIDKAWEAVQAGDHPRIHTFLATSADPPGAQAPHDPRARCSTRSVEMVAYARSLCADVEFSPEDAGRSDPEFLYQALDAAIQAGATTLNIPDTVGYTTPTEFGALIAGIRANVPGIEGVIISVHCHDDLGLATANTLSGVLAGARQVEVTINGIGERAGNTGAGRDRDGAAHAPRRSSAATGHRHHAARAASASWSAPAPASSCSPTRPSSAPTPSRTSRASTRTGCSSTARPTRSCGPRRSAPARTRAGAGQALRARTPSPARLGELGYPLDGRGARSRVRALQGARRPQEAHHRRRPRGARGRRDLPRTSTSRSTACRSAAAPWACPPPRCACAGRTARRARARRRRHRAGRRGLQGDRRDRRRAGDAARVPGPQRDRGHRRARRGERARVARQEASDRRTRRTARPRGRAFRGHGADTDIIVASAKAYLAALNRRVRRSPARRGRGTPTGEMPSNARARRSPPPASRRPGHPPGWRSCRPMRIETAQTLFEKVWDATSSPRSRDAPAVLYIDLHLVHEVTSPQAFAGLRARGLKRAPAGPDRGDDGPHPDATLPAALRRPRRPGASSSRCSRTNCASSASRSTRSAPTATASCTSSAPSSGSRSRA